MHTLIHRVSRPASSGGPGYLLPGWRSEAEPQEAKTLSYVVASCALRASGQQVARTTEPCSGHVQVASGQRAIGVAAPWTRSPILTSTVQSGGRKISVREP